MPRWLLVMLLLLVVGSTAPRAHALPPPPASERTEWRWEPLPVHELDPREASAHAPHVPAEARSHTGPLLRVPGRAVGVWIDAFDTVRIS